MFSLDEKSGRKGRFTLGRSRQLPGVIVAGETVNLWKISGITNLGDGRLGAAIGKEKVNFGYRVGVWAK